MAVTVPRARVAVAVTSIPAVAVAVIMVAAEEAMIARSITLRAAAVRATFPAL
jgi:hypothetical protein